MLLTVIIWGLTLGFASSLHCVGMCGPIGCSLMLLGPNPADRGTIVRRLALLQTGRITAYGLSGLAFSLFGVGLYSSLNFAGTHAVLQWVAALVVIWTGLATAGVVPSLALADRMLAPLASAVGRWRGSPVLNMPEMALIAGFAWGATPCAMVYAALFNSVLTGNPLLGGLLMVSFGVGTIPGVVVSTLALYGSSRGRHRPGRRLAGAALVIGGVVGLLLTAPGSPFCITGA
ncbi:MAG: sulfite exporter TauE/SafE family protein [Candidatus Devosia symbiotica]|nr:sulfite exporter TauE/SafE family protein [Candidatus Devosia symbiotica]